MKAGWVTAAWRLLWCALTAGAYQIATNPFVIAGLLVLPYPFQWVGWKPWWMGWMFWDGHFGAAVWLLIAWFSLHAVAVTLSRERKSRLPGREAVTIFTTPDFLFLLGNEQEGNAPAWYRALHHTWSRWRCAFVFSAWRNKLRNLPFVKALAWLHKPDPGSQDALPASTVYVWRPFGIQIELWCRGWFTELKASKGKWFLDIGPRLDQPDEWGAVSWAFRPWGRL